MFLGSDLHTQYSQLNDIHSQTTEVSLGGYVWEIMQFPDGINRKLLERLYQSLMAYISWHSKVFMVRFDLSLYDSPTQNITMTKFRNYMVRHLEEKYKSKVSFFWVREHNNTKNRCHYHCALLLNGQKVQNTKTTFDLVIASRNIIIDTNSFFPENCGYKIHPRDLQSIQAALFRLSYLAKNATKHGCPQFTKSHQFSRLKPKPFF